MTIGGIGATTIGTPDPAATGGNADPAGGGTQTAWFGNIQDKAISDHITSKGWHQHKTVEEGVSAIIKGHMNAEQLAGKHASQPLRPGKDAQDTEWNDYYSKVRGVNNPGEYKLEFKDGMDKGYFEAAQKSFFDMGLDSRQSKGLFDWHNKFQQEQFDAFMMQSNKDMQELTSEIPVKEFDNYTELSRRAARFAMKEAGISNEGLAAIERVIGTKSFMKMFNKFGQMFKEGVAPNGEGLDNAFRNTPEWAKAEIEKLKGDADFLAKYQSDNPAVRKLAIDKMEQLQKQVHGDKPVT